VRCWFLAKYETFRIIIIRVVEYQQNGDFCETLRYDQRQMGFEPFHTAIITTSAASVALGRCDPAAALPAPVRP
jgi:hypothetical protein